MHECVRHTCISHSPRQVRLNGADTYDAAVFTAAGIQHFHLEFPDCTVAPTSSETARIPPTPKGESKDECSSEIGWMRNRGSHCSAAECDRSSSISVDCSSGSLSLRTAGLCAAAQDCCKYMSLYSAAEGRRKITQWKLYRPARAASKSTKAVIALSLQLGRTCKRVISVFLTDQGPIGRRECCHLTAMARG